MHRLTQLRNAIFIERFNRKPVILPDVERTNFKRQGQDWRVGHARDSMRGRGAVRVARTRCGREPTSRASEGARRI